MTELNQTSASGSSYNIFRALFIAGFVVQLLLYFVPSFSAQVRSGFGAEERIFSTFTFIRYAAQSGVLQAAFIATLLFFVTASFPILAVTYPKRWVFIAGASFSAFFLLMNFLTGSSPELEYFILPQVFGFLASIVTLVGFFTKPPPDIK